MGRFGVEAEFFHPSEGGNVAAKFKTNTRLLWLEVPGSLHMDMADVDAITRCAVDAGVLVAMDNTWATPLGFQPLDHGVTFSVQALTKFVAGHSDVLMGSVCVNDEFWFRELKSTANLLGENVSPDDCALVARGMDTLKLRVRRHSENTLLVGAWLQRHPLVRAVHSPGLQGDPGHSLWKRDFKVAGSLCTISLKENSRDVAMDFIDRLRIFKIGAGFGGAQSLAAAYPDSRESGGFMIRLHFGLEDEGLLIADLENALNALFKDPPNGRQ